MERKMPSHSQFGYKPRLIYTVICFNCLVFGLKLMRRVCRLSEGDSYRDNRIPYETLLKFSLHHKKRLYPTFAVFFAAGLDDRVGCVDAAIPQRHRTRHFCHALFWFLAIAGLLEHGAHQLQVSDSGSNDHWLWSAIAIQRPNLSSKGHLVFQPWFLNPHCSVFSSDFSVFCYWIYC